MSGVIHFSFVSKGKSRKVQCNLGLTLTYLCLWHQLVEQLKKTQDFENTCHMIPSVIQSLAVWLCLTFKQVGKLVIVYDIPSTCVHRPIKSNVVLRRFLFSKMGCNLRCNFI